MATRSWPSTPARQSPAAAAACNCNRPRPRVAPPRHEVRAFSPRAPTPGGRRGLQLQPTPVEEAARKLGVPVLTPKTLRTPEALAEFSAFEADAAVVVAY